MQRNDGWSAYRAVMKIVTKIAIGLVTATCLTAPTSADARPQPHGPVTDCVSWAATGHPYQAIRDTITQFRTRHGTVRATNLAVRDLSALDYAELRRVRDALAPDAYRPGRVETCEVTEANGKRTMILTTRSLAIWHVTQPRLR